MNDKSTMPVSISSIVGTKRCRLTIYGASRNNGIWFLLCTCDCGVHVERSLSNLNKYKNSSCGCWTKDHPPTKKHGQSKSLVYGQWCGMVARCHRETASGYYKYGKKGVIVCERWRESFEAFSADMGPKPDGGTIGRIDNTKGYCPENCRWESTKEQAVNRTDNRLITFQGKTLCLKQWADLTGIGEGTLTGRLDGGWSVERALTQQIQQNGVRGNNLYVDFNGQRRRLVDISKELGISYTCIYQRYVNGKPLDAPSKKRASLKVEVIR